MTDKSVLVLVPRDLFEAVAYFDKGSRTVGELQLWAKDILMRHDNPIKTPAEDVRAVGEEPVAWEAIFDGVQRDVTGRLGFTETARDVYTENGATIEPLYRHPQRPVALPDRKQNTHQGLSHSDARSAGWNACIDEFERLNK